METNLRAGVAVYNEGHHHAAHDAWEDAWLDLPAGTADERLLHALIQFTAAVYHATRGNEEGATGLADSALAYLEGLPTGYRRVDVTGVREALHALECDPHAVGENPPALRYGGAVLRAMDLDVDEIGVAAAIVAEEYGYEEALVETATEYAQTDLEAGQTGSPFVALLFDVVEGDEEARATAFQRMREHVDRRTARESDVRGLFD